MESTYTLSEIINILGGHECGIPTKLFKEVVDNRCETNEEREKILNSLFMSPFNVEASKKKLFTYLTHTELESIQILDGFLKKRLWIYNMTEENGKGYYENVIDIPLLSTEEEKEL